MLQIFDQQSTRQSLFNFIFSLICVSPILGGEFTGVLVAIVYGFYAIVSRGREKDRIAKICLIGFIISAVSSVILALIHWDVIISDIGVPKDTIIHVAWFAAAFMIIDSVRFLVTHYQINLTSFAKTLLVAAGVAVLGKLGYLYAFEGIPVPQLLSFDNRSTPMVDMNPNHSDDIVMSIVFVVAWAIALLRRDIRQSLPNILIGLLTACFMLYLFFGINSRAGFAGIGGSILIILLVLAWRISLRKFGLIVIAMAIGLILLPASLTERFVVASIQVKNIAGSLSEYSSVTHANTKERQAQATKLIDILESPTAHENIEAAIAKVCSGDLDEALDANLKIDPATVHRFLLLIDGVRIYAEKPIFGHGGYAKQEFIANEYNIDNCNIAYFSHIHNNYLDIAIRGGLFAILVFAFLSAMLAYLIKLSFDYSRKEWLRCLVVLAYFPYLYIESLFGMTFNRYSELIAVQIAMLVLLSINLTPSTFDRPTSNSPTGSMT